MRWKLGVYGLLAIYTEKMEEESIKEENGELGWYFAGS